MSADTIIFLHIPKTGGRSLQNILLRRYSKDEAIVNAHGRLDEIAAWPEERKRRIRYLQGHFIYGAHAVLPQQCRYITMLREPVDRVVSHYYYIRRSVNHPLNKIVNDNNMSLDEYVTSGVCEEVSNDQARLVGGVSRDAMVDQEEMLRLAKQHIDEAFIVAGLMERFDETLLLLRKRLGLKNLFYGVRNQTLGRPVKEQLSSRTVASISERNYADIELYRYASKKFEQQIEQAGPAFGRDVQRFQRINHPYSSLFHLVRSVKNKMVGGL